MQDISPYKDLRREFFHNQFENALDYYSYGQKYGAHHWPKWERYEKIVTLSDSQKSIISNFKRKLNVLVLSGTWCGDCQRQGPILKAIADCSSFINLKFTESRNNPDLQNELRINGAEKVPVAVFLSEDFLELQRFGDKHLSVYQRLVQEHSGAYCETGIGDPETDLLALEVEEWMKLFERVQHLLYLSPLLKKRYNN